jgi:hypothetical protein
MPLHALPAPFSAAAVSAVAIPSPTTTPASTPSPTSTSASAEAATPTPSASPAAFARRTGLVDDNVAAHEIVAVKSLNGALGFFVIVNFDKTEPAWLA